MIATVKLNSLARLVQREDGVAYLEYRTRLFNRHELVPHQILAGSMWSRSNVAIMTAADFVEFYMREKYAEAKNWPLIARDFVNPTYAQIFGQSTSAERESETPLIVK
jgi:hypothetical protein